MTTALKSSQIEIVKDLAKLRCLSRCGQNSRCYLMVVAGKDCYLYKNQLTAKEISDFKLMSQVAVFRKTRN